MNWKLLVFVWQRLSSERNYICSGCRICELQGGYTNRERLWVWGKVRPYCTAMTHSDLRNSCANKTLAVPPVLDRQPVGSFGALRKRVRFSLARGKDWHILQQGSREGRDLISGDSVLDMLEPNFPWVRLLWINRVMIHYFILNAQWSCIFGF